MEQEPPQTCVDLTSVRRWPELREDEEFWLDDGTIVLIAREVAFRFYKGALAIHSSVFADMFSLARPDESPSKYDCPVVHLDDTPEDLRWILRAFLPGKSQV